MRTRVQIFGVEEMSSATKLLGEREELWFSGYVEKELPSLEGKNIAITGTTSGTVCF